MQRDSQRLPDTVEALDWIAKAILSWFPSPPPHQPPSQSLHQLRAPLPAIEAVPLLPYPRMVSLRQLESNRRNARHSTGPRTAAGKRRSAQNAFKHGLTALLFTQELNHPHSPEEIEQAVAANYRANTAEEHELIKRIVQGTVRAQLCRHQLQQSFFAIKRGQKEFDGPRGQCGTTLGHLESMRLIMRYLTGHERSVERANQLFYIPRMAKISAAINAKNSAKIAVTQTKQSLTGFVSQKARHRRSRPVKAAA